MMDTAFTRRRAVVALAGLSVASIAAVGAPPAPPTIAVSKDPDCGCCNGWIDHLRAAGFAVEVTETRELDRIKARLGVPPDLHACHTGEVGGYAIEGHVPAAAIRRLLEEKPRAKGLAVPGMPVGSPGMNVEGSPPEEYTVHLFGDFGKRRYARYKEARELPL